MKKVLLSSLLNKEGYVSIRSEKDFDGYVFSYGMPDIILFDTVSWNLVEQIDSIIKGAMYNIEAYDLPDGFKYEFSDEFAYQSEITNILDYYLSFKL